MAAFTQTATSKRRTTHPLRQERRERAQARQASEVRIPDLGPDEILARLAALDARLGEGVGAVRERARLNRRLGHLIRS